MSTRLRSASPWIVTAITIAVDREDPVGHRGSPSTGVDTNVATERTDWITEHCAQVTGAPTGLLTCQA